MCTGISQSRSLEQVFELLAGDVEELPFKHTTSGFSLAPAPNPNKGLRFAWTPLG